jgi:phage terminase large subunit-like protein
MSRRSIAGALADALADGGWRARARKEQIAPLGEWRIWLLLAGRGFGKTIAGANWVHELVQSGKYGRIAMVAPTAADARDTMIEGVSGILETAPNWNRPVYEPSKRKLTWPNGAVATAFSSEEPERLRGPGHDAAWSDEAAAWNDAQATWDQLQFTLRHGSDPRICVTTTPKPIALIKQLVAQEGKGVIITRGSTFDNAANLAPSFLDAIRARYENTRLGKQELHAALLLDVQGSLWPRDLLDRANGSWKIPDMKRVVVAVDPSGTRGAEDSGDSIGIIVAGLGTDGLGYVLADRTCKLSPDGWARVVVNAYREFKADRIIGERNFGGALIEHTIRTVDRNVAYKEVTASRGKIARAEPISALYEQSKIRHAGSFVELEDQLAAMTGDGYVGDGSPDRADALVWALTELMGAKQQEIPMVMPFYAGTPRFVPCSDSNWATQPPGGWPAGKRPF